MSTDFTPRTLFLKNTVVVSRLKGRIVNNMLKYVTWKYADRKNGNWPKVEAFLRCCNSRKLKFWGHALLVMIQTCTKNQADQGGLCISGVSVLQKATLNILQRDLDIYHKTFWMKFSDVHIPETQAFQLTFYGDVWNHHSMSISIELRDVNTIRRARWYRNWKLIMRKSKWSCFSYSLAESFSSFFSCKCQIKVACQIIRLVSLFNIKMGGIDVSDIFPELLIVERN